MTLRCSRISARSRMAQDSPVSSVRRTIPISSSAHGLAQISGATSAKSRPIRLAGIAPKESKIPIQNADAEWNLIQQFLGLPHLAFERALALLALFRQADHPQMGLD